MAPTRPRRSPSVQPELPLPVADRGPIAATEVVPAPDWRLDDRTRLIGRRGIAEARARLASAAARAGTADDTGRRRSDRAA